MRILKAFGMTMLVSGLVLGLAVAVTAASASVNVNASFTIPTWISLSVTSGATVGFGDIGGGGGSYTGSNATNLRILSTVSWTITSAIQWSDSAVPAGTVDEALIETALGIPYSTSGTRGVTAPAVNYTMTITDEQMTSLPVGDYDLVIQYTATTD